MDVSASVGDVVENNPSLGLCFHVLCVCTHECRYVCVHVGAGVYGHCVCVFVHACESARE